MSEKTSTDASQEPQLREHVYDGIQEYDNPLPAWWFYMFLITIIWVVYAIVFFGTLAIRKVKHIYVANWFLLSFIVSQTLLKVTFKLFQLYLSISVVVSLRFVVQQLKQQSFKMLPTLVQQTS